MDNIKDKQSGFNVESILLTESSFTRKGKINFSESEQEVSFETGVGSRDNTVNVKLTTTVTNKLKDEEQYKIVVSFVGVFKRLVILKYQTMNSLVELMVLPSFFLLFVSILPISH